MIPGLVTCIVPVHNGERYLADTLESMLAQTYLHREILVIDDGSVDGTRQVATRYGRRVAYHYQSNAGPGPARNRGLREARGEFVAFLDADDLWHCMKLERQLAALCAEPQCSLCITYLRNVPSERTIPLRSQPEPPAAGDLPGFSASTLLAARAVFDRIGSFDENLLHAHTIDWLRRAREDGVCEVIVPETLVYRRLHDANRSRRFGSRSRTEYLHWLKHTLDRRRTAS